MEVLFTIIDIRIFSDPYNYEADRSWYKDTQCYCCTSGSFKIVLACPCTLYLINILIPQYTMQLNWTLSHPPSAKWSSHNYVLGHVQSMCIDELYSAYGEAPMRYIQPLYKTRFHPEEVGQSISAVCMTIHVADLSNPLTLLRNRMILWDLKICKSWKCSKCTISLYNTCTCTMNTWLYTIMAR